MGLARRKKTMSEQRHLDVATGAMPSAQAVAFADLIAYQPGAVVSRAIVKKNAGTLTLFAFDIGQGLSEHSAPFDAVVEILDGEAELTIGGKKVAARAGQAVLMPANIPHALSATTPFKMLLVMVREAG
jgi:quercetin dioxygenase-like cupin family protein